MMPAYDTTLLLVHYSSTTSSTSSTKYKVQSAYLYDTWYLHWSLRTPNTWNGDQENEIFSYL